VLKLVPLNPHAKFVAHIVEILEVRHQHEETPTRPPEELVIRGKKTARELGVARNSSSAARRPKRVLMVGRRSTTSA
jgi:hypothetical protein